MTFIAGLRLTGMTAPWVLDDPMDGTAFCAYVRHILAPTLKRGDVVVLDNLPAHKVAGVREAIAERRAQIFYLPPYSPDLNPIEMAFSKLRPCSGMTHHAASTASFSASVCFSTASSPPDAPTSSMPPDINGHHENALRGWGVKWLGC